MSPVLTSLFKFYKNRVYYYLAILHECAIKQHQNKYRKQDDIYIYKNA